VRKIALLFPVTSRNKRVSKAAQKLGHKLQNQWIQLDLCGQQKFRLFSASNLLWVQHRLLSFLVVNQMRHGGNWFTSICLLLGLKHAWILPHLPHTPSWCGALLSTGTVLMFSQWSCGTWHCVTSSHGIVLCVTRQHDVTLCYQSTWQNTVIPGNMAQHNVLSGNMR